MEAQWLNEETIVSTPREQRALWIGIVIISFLLACGLGVLTTIGDDTPPRMGSVAADQVSE